jgi:hypothetical protein
MAKHAGKNTNYDFNNKSPFLNRQSSSEAKQVQKQKSTSNAPLASSLIELPHESQRTGGRVQLAPMEMKQEQIE